MEFLEIIFYLSKLLTQKNELVYLDLNNQEHREKAKFVIGGIGLFGVIIEAKLKLVFTNKSIYVKRITFNNIDKIKAIFQSNKENYITLWIDTFNINLRGFAEVGDLKNSNTIAKKKTINFFSKIFNLIQKIVDIKLNSFLIKLFNLNLYYISFLNKKNKYKNLFDYYFPFGQIPNHHKFFSKGMYEIQIFLPGELNIENLISIFKLLRKYNIYSWLSGLKFHKKEEYIFSFCDYGISISLNFSGKQIQQEKF